MRRIVAGPTLLFTLLGGCDQEHVGERAEALSFACTSSVLSAPDTRYVSNLTLDADDDFAYFDKRPSTMGVDNVLAAVPLAGGAERILYRDGYSLIESAVNDADSVFFFETPPNPTSGSPDPYRLMKVSKSGGVSTVLITFPSYVLPAGIAIDNDAVYYMTIGQSQSPRPGVTQLARIPRCSSPIETVLASMGDGAEPILDGGYVYFASAQGPLLRVPRAGGSIERVGNWPQLSPSAFAMGSEYIYLGDAELGLWGMRRCDGSTFPVAPATYYHDRDVLAVATNDRAVLWSEIDRQWLYGGTSTWLRASATDGSDITPISSTMFPRAILAHGNQWLYVDDGYLYSTTCTYGTDGGVPLAPPRPYRTVPSCGATADMGGDVGDASIEDLSVPCHYAVEDADVALSDAGAPTEPVDESTTDMATEQLPSDMQRAIVDGETPDSRGLSPADGSDEGGAAFDASPTAEAGDAEATEYGSCSCRIGSRNSSNATSPVCFAIIVALAWRRRRSSRGKRGL